MNDKIAVIRGATTVNSDTVKDICESVTELVGKLVSENGLNTEDNKPIFCIISSTADITAYYPARAVRESGILDCPLFSCLEPPIKGSLPMCVRVMVDAVGLDSARHVYLRGAKVLRPDLCGTFAVAIDGPSGAGKSTIVNLISRFYNVTSGRVLVDDQDISKVTLHSLRSQMGIMLQDSFIFSGTIEDNIRYGKLDATAEEIKEASKVVCADSFIESMADGYQTEVKERGSLLSQGQRQLISFARTLLSDPSILVLDEATSSIDVQTEKALQQGLNAMLQGRTSFIIAHRLSTIKNCDKIMYISDGGIQECGTHDELMAKKGAYYKLYTAQMGELGVA